MKDRIPKTFHMQDEKDAGDNNFYVASSMDCTGLIPSAPASEHEVDSYNELCDIPLASDPKDANHHLQDLQKADSSLFPDKPPKKS